MSGEVIDFRTIRRPIEPSCPMNDVNQVMLELRPDLAHEVGGFEVGETMFKNVKEVFGVNKYQIIDEIISNTGRVLFVEVYGGILVVKTDLDQNHAYLNFKDKWVRLWSLAAECNMVQAQDSGSHLGILGIERIGNDKVIFRELGDVVDDQIEPGLVMRPYDQTLLDVAQDDIRGFVEYIPDLVRGMVKMCQELPWGYNQEQLGGAKAFVDNIKSGNLQFLLADDEKLMGGITIGQKWHKIWNLGQKAIGRHWQLLNQRQVAVRHGDNGLYNSGILEGNRVGWFDPVMLPLIYKRGGQGEILKWGAALWNIDNIERSLGAATVDLRLFEEMAKSVGLISLADDYAGAREIMFDRLAEEIGWQTISKDKLILIKFGEAYWAQVRAEIYLRKSRELRKKGKGEEADKYLDWFMRLTAICYETFSDLFYTDPVSIS